MQIYRRQIILMLVCLLWLTACQSNRIAQVETVKPQLETILPTETATARVEKIPLVVFAAGSLIIPFAELETAFEARYPQIDVLAEYHGSIQVMRHVTELHEPIDVAVTADAALVPMLMYTSENPQTGRPYADWFIRFAGNKLALAYTKNSLYANEINQQNWPEILSRSDVKYGLADPRFDAAGYRSLMAFALHENSIEDYSLFKGMFKDQFTSPVSIFRDDTSTLIRVPEILETKSNSHILMRGASVFLIALMESGDLDYAFEYESVIRQHGLEMLSLPNTVNLSENSLADFYQQVEVKLDFQRFSTVKPQFFGEPIAYAITIPDSSPHPEEAQLFIQFLLEEEGRAIMAANDQPLLDVYTADNFNNLPEALQAYCLPSP